MSFVAQDTSVPDQTPSPSVFDSQNPFIKYVSEFNSTQKQLNTQIISRFNEHQISRVPEFRLKLLELGPEFDLGYVSLFSGLVIWIARVS